MSGCYRENNQDKGTVGTCCWLMFQVETVRLMPTMKN